MASKLNQGTDLAENLSSKKKQGGRVVLQPRRYHLSAQPAAWPRSRAGAAAGVSRARAASAAVAVEDLAACSFQRKRLWYLL